MVAPKCPGTEVSLRRHRCPRPISARAQHPTPSSTAPTARRTPPAPRPCCSPRFRARPSHIAPARRRCARSTSVASACRL
eukprot:4182436-Prymnesium_polylepis.1